jgi:mannitol-1-phosphate 5-dehydrogenase
MTLSNNQEAALERKLYIKNTGHFAIGVLGYLKGYTLMDEAARDPEIFDRVDAATRESAAAVVAKHGLSPEETEQYRRTFLEQMTSPFLPDDITRVIREPIRKLAREERLVGPAMLACDQRQSPGALAYVIAAAFRAVNPDDPQSLQLQSRLNSDGLESTLTQVCGIPQGHLLSDLIAQAYRTRFH